MRGGSVNYGGMDDGYVPDYHTGRRISATQYQQQQYEQVHNIVKIERISSLIQIIL